MVGASYSAEALACYECVLAEVPDPDALYNAGSICQEGGNLELARSYYLRALELNPDEAEIRYNIAGTYLLEDRFAESLEIFQSLSLTDPDDEHLHQAVEHCLDKLGRTEEAARHRLYRMKLAVPDPTSDTATPRAGKPVPGQP